MTRSQRWLGCRCFIQPLEVAVAHEDRLLGRRENVTCVGSHNHPIQNKTLKLIIHGKNSFYIHVKESLKTTHRANKSTAS